MTHFFNLFKTGTIQTSRRGPLGSETIRTIADAIKTLSFTSRHLSYVRAFSITGLTQRSVKDVEFEEGSKKTTVFKYFQEKYPEFAKGLNQNLPCVKYGPKNKPKFMPIECVYLLPNEEYRPKLKADQQSNVTQLSSQQKPVVR